MADGPYSARGQSVDQIMVALEDGRIVEAYSGGTDIYVQAALTAAAARAQERWAKRATLAAWGSFAVAVAAVVVAALR